MATRSRAISSEFLFFKTMALFVFWILLSSSFDWIHLTLGLICSFGVAWLNSGHSPFVPKFRLWFRVILYLPWLFYKIVQSSVYLSKLILDPALPISPQLITVESKLNHHAAIVLFGNSITLTPGTITAEIDQNKLIVHAIDKGLSEDLVGSEREMEFKIAEVFRDEEPDL
jgi:multicomponent Na+:H+ antiporter subunit E